MKLRSVKMSVKKKLGLVLSLSVATLGNVWGLTSIKFGLTQPSDLSRFTGVYGWQTSSLYANATDVEADWRNGGFLSALPEPNFMLNQGLTYNSSSGAYKYSPIKYFSMNTNEMHVFVLVKLPKGMNASDLRGPALAKYVVAGPWVGTIPAATYKIMWGTPGDPQLRWRDEELLSSSAKTFSADVATSARTINSVDEILPFAHSVNAWGAASVAAQASITYTFNGGAAQTLGAYADGDVATWAPTKNGTYVFQHTPGSGITATFNVEFPFTGSGTEDDPYVVTSANGLRQVAELGGWVRLGADIISDATLPAGLMLYLDLNGQKLSGTIINNGTLTLLDGVGGCDPALDITGGGTVIDNMVKVDKLSFKQRYPWNGLVDVSYEASGLLEGKTYAVRFSLWASTAREMSPISGGNVLSGDNQQGGGSMLSGASSGSSQSGLSGGMQIRHDITTMDDPDVTFTLTNVVNGTNKYVWNAAAADAFGENVTNASVTVKAAIYCTSKKVVPAQ